VHTIVCKKEAKLLRFKAKGERLKGPPKVAGKGSRIKVKASARFTFPLNL